MKRSELIALIISSALAILYIFLPPKLVIAMGLGILRHNDRVMIGTIGLIIAVVILYKLIRERLT